MRPKQSENEKDAEALAINALSFLANDDALLNRFLALSGIEAPQLRRAAQEPGFLAGVLAFIAAHEPTLLAFAAEAGVNPSSVTRALARLPAGDPSWDAST